MCHPDIAGEEAAEICILLNQAYVTLSDERERSRYNAELERYKEALASGVAGYTGTQLRRRRRRRRRPGRLLPQHVTPRWSTCTELVVCGACF
eukprot:scaffold7446_cov403-Prasinococcus_capsulatus_cf.AAC.11